MTGKLWLLKNLAAENSSSVLVTVDGIWIGE
jgi:hypothetical protein